MTPRNEQTTENVKVNDSKSSSSSTSSDNEEKSSCDQEEESKKAGDRVSAFLVRKPTVFEKKNRLVTDDGDKVLEYKLSADSTAMAFVAHIKK